jgi:hypothetical protein
MTDRWVWPRHVRRLRPPVTGGWVPMGIPVELTSSGEDDGVEAQSCQERCDRAKGGYNILAASQHQTAEDDDPERSSSGSGQSPRNLLC